MPLLGDAFEGFLHHLVEFFFTPERHDEAVMNSEDRRVVCNKLLDDVFAYARVEVHQTQTCTVADQVADLGVSTFDAVKQRQQDIIGEAVLIGCVVEFVY